MSQKIKVLYTITDLGKGGAERFLMDLLADLDQNYPGIDYRVACVNKIIEYDEFKDHPKVHFVDYQPFTRNEMLGFKKPKNEKYTQLLNEFQPDIIHSNLFLGEFITAYDLRPNIHYICHGHDNMIQFRPVGLKDIFNKEKLLYLLEYRFLVKNKYKKVLTHFIANSNDTFCFYKAKNLGNVELIHLGFDYHKFYKEKEYKEIKKLRLINVGSYQPKKNQQFAVDIAETLKNRGIDYELNLIGAGSEYQAVANKIKEKGLENHVFQHGLQSNMEEWYQNSDIYLHTAYYEPFGLVFLEAMASGLPIVCLDGKGNRDIIENDKNGFLIEEQNVESFADKIIEYTKNLEKYKAISSYAQQFAKQFDVSVKNEELIAFYKKIIT